MQHVNSYLLSVKKQFKYYQSLGQKTFDQLEEEQLFWMAGEEENSIAIIVNHLWGNMLSRWTDFLTSDGEKEWRKRDQEFEDQIQDRKNLLDKWNAGWNCLYAALDGLTTEDLEKEIFIRNMGHSVIEAINRQFCHYAYHIGQIVFIGKIIKGKEWQSLSIPKGQSEAYNAEKFAKEKRRTHFTEDL